MFEGVRLPDAAVLRANIDVFTDDDFRGDYDTVVTGDLAAAAGHGYPPPKVFPRRGVHPRVLLTHEELPAIREALVRAEKEMPRMWAEYTALLASASAKEGEPWTFGRLPPAVDRGGCNYYNADFRVSAAIEALALEYLLTGDECRGLAAVNALLNYLASLDIRCVYSDQCRYFGYFMFLSALVYDWCLPLLRERDKYRIVLAVEKKLCTGDTPLHTKKSDDHRMEIGFPPDRQNAVTGHGTENQLLRDYLAFSAAIYDEWPGWYTFVAGRIFAEYADVRGHYYSAGMVPQGTNYAAARFLSDLWSAWIFDSVSPGFCPYDRVNMERAAWAEFSYEIADGAIYNTGDDNHPTFRPSAAEHALLAAALFRSPGLAAEAKFIRERFPAFRYEAFMLSPSEQLILYAKAPQPAADRHAGLPLTVWNGSWMGQYIVRTGWTREDASAILKVGERTTANHDHCDAGTFQLSYKGLITGGAGAYTTQQGAGYGTDHHYFFHQATVSHNGLLIFDPTRSSREDVRVSDELFPKQSYDERAARYYSGGQRHVYETKTLAGLLSDEYRTAAVVWRGDAEYADHRPLYAAVTGDLTAAYPAGAADSVIRSMAAVFPRGDAVPLLLFIRDRIVADPAFPRTFLLQTWTEPTATENGLFCEQGDGRMTLFRLRGGDRMDLIGGPGKEFFAAGRNFSVSAVPRQWGRAEVTESGRRETEFLHVIAMTDRGVAVPFVPQASQTEDGVEVSVPGVRVRFVKDGKICITAG